MLTRSRSWKPQFRLIKYLKRRWCKSRAFLFKSSVVNRTCPFKWRVIWNDVLRTFSLEKNLLLNFLLTRTTEGIQPPCHYPHWEPWGCIRRSGRQAQRWRFGAPPSLPRRQHAGHPQVRVVFVVLDLYRIMVQRYHPDHTCLDWSILHPQGLPHESGTRSPPH